MKKNLKLIISPAFIALAFLSPQTLQGMEDSTKQGETKTTSGIQLNKVTDDALEAVLGAGNNIMLKISMDLKNVKEPVNQKQAEVPVRLFLIDFTSSPTNHPDVNLKFKVDWKSATPICTLLDKPQSFDSYDQFIQWLSHGYFTSQSTIIYNFHIDIHQSAPSLAQHLFAIPLGGYHFSGAYAIDSGAIKPDRCVPQVTYSSKRGNTNATIVTLGGTFYLNNQSYPVVDHSQTFPHLMIEEVVFKRDETKKFYSHKWLAQSEATAKVTYEEFPKNLIHDWPNPPSGAYSVLRQKPGDLEEIEHLACWDGASGEDVNISDGRIFLIECDALHEEGDQFLERIVKDDMDNRYTVRYKYSMAEQQRRLACDRQQQQEIERRLAKKTGDKSNAMMKAVIINIIDRKIKHKADEIRRNITALDQLWAKLQFAYRGSTNQPRDSILEQPIQLDNVYDRYEPSFPGSQAPMTAHHRHDMIRIHQHMYLYEKFDEVRTHTVRLRSALERYGAEYLVLTGHEHSDWIQVKSLT